MGICLMSNSVHPLRENRTMLNTARPTITDLIYDEIGIKNDEFLSGYNLVNIIVKQDNLYGIISYREGTVIEEIKYQDSEINTLLDLINKETN